VKYFLPLRLIPRRGEEGFLCARFLSFHRGSLLLEAILSIALFAAFVAAVGGVVVVGQQSTISGGDRVRAVSIAEGALDAMRAIRDDSFASITPGTYTPTRGSNGRWQLVNGATTTSDGYRYSVVVSQHATDWMEALATVTWNFGERRSGSIAYTTYLTNWHAVATIGNWATPKLVKKIDASTSTHYRKVQILGSYALVGGLTTDGGPGLTIYDISNPTSPTRVNAGFNLGYSVYDMSVDDDNHLFLITSDQNRELMVFDATNPLTLSFSHLSGSYNVPGSGIARSVASYADMVFVGTAENTTQPEFFGLTMAQNGALTLGSSLEIGGGVNDISLHEGYAYLATTLDTLEFEVVDVFDVGAISIAPGNGLDLNDTYDGVMMAASFGTSAVIGRQASTTLPEITIASIADSPIPQFPPGPYTYEVNGDPYDFAVDPSIKYGFIASNGTATQLRVVNMSAFLQGTSSLAGTYDAGGTLYGLSYSWQRDRLFAVSDRSFFVFSPS
jgi:hypothetical protein